MIVGEAPGEEEVKRGQPFVGYSGQELDKILGEAGLRRGECFLTNVIRIRPPGNDVGHFVAMRKADITPQHMLVRDRYCLPPVWEGSQLLAREIELCRPNAIIALGNVSLWALTGKWGITSWRGSLLECDMPTGLDYRPKVIPAYHPAAVLRQWSWRPILVHDIKRAAREAASRELRKPDWHFYIRPDFQTARDVLEALLAVTRAKPTRLSVDIETRNGHIACVGIAWSATEAICIPLMCVERAEGYWTESEEVALAWLMYQVLTHPNVQVIGQNFIYDAQYFYRWLCFIPRFARDTMIAQHSMFSNLPKSLDFLSSMYCEYHVYWKDDGKDWDDKTGEDQLWEYNCVDAIRTFEIDEAEQRAVDALGVRGPHDFQQSLFYPVLRTMNKGVRINQARRGRFAAELIEEIAKREAWLHNVLGFPLNIRSPKQMQELFYGALGQKVILHRKSRTPTLDDEALRKIASREPVLRPVVKKIQELRSLGVFLSTFVQAPLDVDGRMRCSFNIAGTETYRFSSSTNAFGSGLNLQNIPSGGGDDELELPNVRTLFTPDPGYTFFDIDLNSADLRIVVWESDEPEMKAMLAQGLDPYTEIAKEFYHDTTITKKDPRRQKFKAFAHGTNYLGTAKGLAERLGLSIHEAERTQAWYFQRFPRIKRWQDDLKDQVVKRRMVQNVFGYRCYFFDRIEGTVFNQAAAWIPQSTVGCLINRAYVAIDRELADVEVLLQVHDSLAGQYPTASAVDWKSQIIDLAQIPLPYDDPLTIPVGVKTSAESWGDCK